MPQIPINKNICINFRREDSCLIETVELTKELFLEIFGTSDGCSLPIKIKRTSSFDNRRLCVSGELKIMLQSRLIWERKFSEFMDFGSSFIDISNPIYKLNLYFGINYRLRGFVHIAETSECYQDPFSIMKSETEHISSDLSLVKSSANEETKKGVQLKSLENEDFDEVIDKNCLKKLLKDLERLLDPNQSSYTDVTLKCGDVSIPAHKNILSARSPVFEAMFNNPMKENQKNEVDITDIDESTLRALLVYIYTGKTSDLTASSAADLMFAADKYQLQNLKNVCSDFLKGTVSLQNVLRILVIGDMLDEDLKSFAVDYICNKSAEFSVLEKTEEWKSLQKDRPALAMDILTTLVKAMNEKSRK